MIGASAGSLLTHIKWRGLVLRNGYAAPPASPSPPKTLGVARQMNGLIVCRQAEKIAIFSALLREIWIEAEKCDSAPKALDLLRGNRFEALVLDFDDLANCADVARNVRSHRPNQDIPIFAIASDDQSQATALAAGASFLLDQTLDQRHIRSLLGTVRGRMLRSSQTYFRLNVEIPVSVARAAGPVLHCATINLSLNGMAVSTPASLACGEKLHLVFALPPRNTVTSGEGTVIWDDGHGKAGIQFECSSASAKQTYSEWLHDHFCMQLGPETENPELQPRAYAT